MDNLEDIFCFVAENLVLNSNIKLKVEMLVAALREQNSEITQVQLLKVCSQYYPKSIVNEVLDLIHVWGQ